MTAEDIAKSIQTDIDSSMYDQFEKLKERLQYISEKLLKIHYCNQIDIERQLSVGELKTLEENEYITKS